MSGHGLVGQSEDKEGIGEAGVGGEDLLAVDDVLVAVLHGHGAGTGHVRTSAGLSQTEAANLGAVGQGAQPLLLLLLGAELLDGGGAQRGMYGKGDAGAGIDLGHLLHAQHIGEHIAAGAAILLGEGDAEETTILHLLQQAAVILLLLVHLVGERLDALFSKLAVHVLEFLVHRVEGKVDHDRYLPFKKMLIICHCQFYYLWNLPIADSIALPCSSVNKIF